MKLVLRVFYIGFLFVVVAVCISMSKPIALEEECINIVQRSFRAFGSGDCFALTDLYSPGYLHHAPDFNDPVSFDEYELSFRIVHSHVPDLQIRIVDIFACNGKVAVRYVWEYHSDSDQFKCHYPGGVAQGSAISIYRIDNGKIVEEWCEYDPGLIKRFCIIYKRLNHIE